MTYDQLVWGENVQNLKGRRGQQFSPCSAALTRGCHYPRPCCSFLPAQQLGTNIASSWARKGEEEGKEDRAENFSSGCSSLGLPTTLLSRHGPGTTY